MQHHIADGSLADWSNLPLRVPRRGESHGSQQAYPVVPAVSQLHLLEFGIVLPLDEAEYGSFDRMANVWRHEFIVVTPTAQFPHGVDVIVEPWTIQCVACSRLCREVKRVHDAGEQQ